MSDDIPAQAPRAASRARLSPLVGILVGIPVGAAAAGLLYALDPSVGHAWAAGGFAVVVAAVLVALERGQRRAARAVTAAQDETVAREGRYRAIVEHSSDMIFVYGEDGGLLDVTPAVERATGYTADELLGHTLLDFFHPDERSRGFKLHLQLISTPGTTEPVLFRIQRKDGTCFYAEAVATNMLDNPYVGGIVVNARDVTDRVRYEADLASAQEMFRRAFEDAPIGMVLSTLAGDVERANRAFARMVGRPTDALVGHNVREFTHPDDRSVTESHLERLAAGTIDRYHVEKRYLHSQGRIVWGSASASLLNDADAAPRLIVQIEDITERKAVTERLEHQAMHDPMTGLPNRTLFMDRLALALDRSARRHSRVALVFLDLDRFKLVNDSLGHAVGDKLLQAVADRLRASLRPTDTMARFGGDEFIVLCNDVGDVASVRAIAERLSGTLATPIALAEGDTYVSASVGIALSEPGDTADTLLRDADTAMFRAKESGRARIEAFDVKARHRAVDSLSTGNALHRALERGEFVVHYQPIVSVRTGTVKGFEALVRWQHPERGLVPPDEFIPLAEETGLIVPLGLWVLEEACRQTKVWQVTREPNRTPLTISVNLAPRQLSEPTLPARVAEVLQRTGIDPDTVWLEITESTLMHDAESAVSALQALRAQGVHLSVDDFGTGYSSLLYLRRFPVEALKVDRSFVDGLGRESEDSAIVGGVVGLAHALNLEAVAEGLETDLQLARLRTLGCDYAQGFLLGRPQPASVLGDRPADDLTAWQEAVAPAYHAVTGS